MFKGLFSLTEKAQEEEMPEPEVSEAEASEAETEVSEEEEEAPAPPPKPKAAKPKPPKKAKAPKAPKPSAKAVAAARVAKREHKRTATADGRAALLVDLPTARAEKILWRASRMRTSAEAKDFTRQTYLVMMGEVMRRAAWVMNLRDPRAKQMTDRDVKYAIRSIGAGLGQSVLGECKRQVRHNAKRPAAE